MAFMQTFTPINLSCHDDILTIAMKYVLRCYDLSSMEI